jgi:hypothetical protein
MTFFRYVSFETVGFKFIVFINGSKTISEMVVFFSTFASKIPGNFSGLFDLF